MAAALQIIGQQWEGAAAQQDTILRAADPSAMEFIEWQATLQISNGRGWLPNRIQFIMAADRSAKGID